ncbi:MAG: HAMP domain-containing sensor histidine kinase [Gemmatimonadota bacterium]|jgi:signal transduction histidine kinase
MSLKRALLLLVLLVLATGLIPAGVLLERRLGEALVERTRDDLARASMVLENRWAAVSDVRMMHARELAGAPGLAEALREGEMQRARQLVTLAAAGLPEEPVLVDGSGRALGGDPPPRELVDATRRGEMPVAVVSDTASAHLLALAPVKSDGRWVGAAGGQTAVDESEAGTLSGLTRSDVLILTSGGHVITSTLPEELGFALASVLDPTAARDTVVEVAVGEHTFLAAAAPLGKGLAGTDQSSPPGWVVFARDLDEELAVLPSLRRTGAVVGGLALLFALVVGGIFATGLARPAEALADAADRFAVGDTDAPLPRSSVAEIRRVSEAFATMRRTLSARLQELEEANRELEDRQERLQLLQAELVQRERLAASGRLLAQLAHEIRNPIASVRNCMEVVRRRADLKGDAALFADMALDELLRMHELAERMLDLHRPRDPADAACHVGEVAREVALLVRAGSEDGVGVGVVGDVEVQAAIPPEALKQVLLNLVLNAREVSDAGASVEIVVRRREERVTVEVLDRGPGIPEDALERVFDPFFTTKDAVHGVGLGLFTAEALVRTYGGAISASNREDGLGARFSLELPLPEGSGEGRGSVEDEPATAPDAQSGEPTTA